MRILLEIGLRCPVAVLGPPGEEMLAQGRSAGGSVLKHLGV
jgi:hypothetical protein